jgi:hypothetical protein
VPGWRSPAERWAMSRCWLHPQMAHRLSSSPVDTRLEHRPWPFSSFSLAWKLPASALPQLLPPGTESAPAELVFAHQFQRFGLALNLLPGSENSAERTGASPPVQLPEQNKRCKETELWPESFPDSTRLAAGITPILRFLKLKNDAMISAFWADARGISPLAWTGPGRGHARPHERPLIERRECGSGKSCPRLPSIQIPPIHSAIAESDKSAPGLCRCRPS